MKKQDQTMDLTFLGVFVAALMGMIAVTIIYGGDLFSSNLISLPSVSRGLEASGALSATSTVDGTPQWISNSQRQQYAPAAVTAVAGTPQWVNDVVRQQYVPAAVTAVAGTPQWVNDVVRQQYAPAAVTAVAGTPQWVNDVVRQQYAPASL